MIAQLRSLYKIATLRPYLAAFAVFSAVALYKLYPVIRQINANKGTLGHRGIGSLLHDMGYKDTLGGICNGYRRAVIFAYFAGQTDLFLQALEDLNHLNAKDRALLVNRDAKLLTSRMWNVHALCDHIALNQNLETYQDWAPNESELQEMSDRASQQGCVDHMTYCAKLFDSGDTSNKEYDIQNLHDGYQNKKYTYKEWVAVFKEITKACEKLDAAKPIALSIFAYAHTNVFLYNANKKEWHAADANYARSWMFSQSFGAESAAEISWKIACEVNIQQLFISLFLKEACREFYDYHYSPDYRMSFVVSVDMKSPISVKNEPSLVDSLSGAMFVALNSCANVDLRNQMINLCLCSGGQQSVDRLKKRLLLPLEGCVIESCFLALAKSSWKPDYELEKLKLLLTLPDIDPNPLVNDQDNKRLLDILGSDDPIIPMIRQHKNFKEKTASRIHP